MAFNTFVDCRNTLLIGYGTSDDQTLPPEDCVIANNVIQTSYQIARIGDSEGTPVNFFWEGNIFYGDELGISDPGGITWQSPELQASSDYLFRPSSTSPLIGTAVGDYAQITTDIDGQVRSAPFDVGCDEGSTEPVAITPLFKDDVGVDWFISGPVAVEVTAGENTLIDALSILSDEDTLKLITDGGLYQLTENFIVDRRIIIQAAKGLSEKPVITRGSSGSDDPVLFEIQGFGELFLHGVILDGGADSESMLSALIATVDQPFSEYFRIIAEDCEFNTVHYGGNGSFLKLFPGTRADSIIFTNCTFSDCDGIGFRLNSEAENSGKYNVQNLEIQNCTFWNIGREAISVYAGDNVPFSIGPAVIINHCTFDNCGTSGTPIVHLKEVDNAVITNSIFSNSSLDTAAVIIYGWAYIEYCDIFNAGSVALERGAHQYDGMINLDPLYNNASEGDFTLAYSSPVRDLGKDGKALGDLRWAGDVENSTEPNKTVMVEEFELHQNYPNPFNGQTRISYMLSKPAVVEIQIFNLNGSPVTHLDKSYKAPGNYSLNWRPEFRSSAVYICRIMVDDQAKMIKMIYVK